MVFPIAPFRQQVVAGRQDRPTAKDHRAELLAALDDAALLLEESRVQIDLIGKPDQMEVIAAQMQGRAPVFK